MAAREEEPICTTQQLAKAVGYTHMSGGGKKKGDKGKQIHPATRTFQVGSSNAFSSRAPASSKRQGCPLGEGVG